MNRVFILASYPESLSNFRGALITTLVERGNEVHVAAPNLKANKAVCKYLESVGAICHEAKFSRTGLNPVSDLLCLLALCKLISKIKPNTFIGYTIKPVVWGLKAANFVGVENRVALITGLGYAFTGKAKGLRGVIQKIARILYKSSLKKASLVFFQNPDDLKEFAVQGLLSQHTRRKVVNGSGVDIGKFALTPLPPKVNINFLLIARLLGDKGICEYVAAAREVLKRYPNAQFHLVGGLDTNPNAILEDRVRGWVEEGTVKWHGGVDDVRPFILDCHVFVLPSYREGTPRSVLEAMSMGRAIITTDAPGCRETVVDGDNGFLVDVKSVEQLVAAMERFIKQPELIETMGKRSREIACDKYDVNKVNDVMLKAMGIIKE
jgi:glycosyltransferase involved in cell wall biosynthesis